MYGIIYVYVCRMRLGKMCDVISSLFSLSFSFFRSLTRQIHIQKMDNGIKPTFSIRFLPLRVCPNSIFIVGFRWLCSMAIYESIWVFFFMCSGSLFFQGIKSFRFFHSAQPVCRWREKKKHLSKCTCGFYPFVFSSKRWKNTHTHTHTYFFLLPFFFIPLHFYW